MIAVAGFNTSVDKALETDELRPGAVHRVRAVRSWPGGKGLHVALTVATLGEPVGLVGLMDESHRERFSRLLRERGVAFHEVASPEGIRTCLAVREACGLVTEFLESGPQVDAATRASLLDRFREVAAEAELAVLSGSLPPGFDDSTYATLVRELHRRGLRCLVDASGPLLRQATAARPYLVKPNRDEAAALTGGTVYGVDSAARALRELAAAGVAVPVVSLGAEGAVAWTGARVLHASVSSLPAAINPVGSGDCLLGGLAVALARGDTVEEALRLGVACGAANAASPETGFVRREDVDRLRRQVQVAEAG